MLHQDLPLRVDLGDGLLHRVGHAAGDGEAPAQRGAGGELVVGVVGHLRGDDALGVEDALHLLEGEHEVHVAADGAAGGLQLLGGAWADEYDAHVRVVLLVQPGGEHHGSHGHGDVVLELGEQLLGHHAPGGAAGGGHKGLLVGNLLQEVLGLLGGAHVGAHGHLDDLVEAHLAHGLPHLGGGDLLAKLADKGGRHGGHHLVAPLDGLNQLEDLALVGDGAEGAVHQAHAAGDALVVVDLGPSQLVGADGVHAAGLGAGALKLQDGAVGALVGTLAALDALLLVDEALALNDGDGVLGADLLTGVGQTALAHVGHLHPLGGAGVAGKGNNVDQRGIVVLLRHQAVLQVGVRGLVLAHVPQGQTDGQPDALADHSPLHQDVLAVLGHLAGDDFVGQLPNGFGVVAPLKGHPGYLGKDLAPDIVDKGMDTAHLLSPPLFCRKTFILHGSILP